MLIASHDSKTDEMWYLDGGPSKQIIGTKNLFSNLSGIDHGKVMIGDDTHKIEVIGEINFKTKYENV